MPRHRRLLVITYHFVPDGSIGGLRWSGLSKYLARRGWIIDVVTAAAQGNHSSPAGVQVHHCPRAGTVNDLYNRIAVRLRRSRAAGGTGGAADQAPGASAAVPQVGPLGWLRSNLGDALGFPDYGRGWITRAALRARALLDSNAFDLVVTSGPPHSAHIAGAIACAGRSEPHWMDMRDPWSPVQKGWQHALAGSSLRRLGVRALENVILSRAERVITNTVEFAELLRELHPALRVSYVPNGVDLERLPRPNENRLPGLSITHAGTLYAGRDLSGVMRALSQVLRKRPDAAASLRLHVAGSMGAAHAAAFYRQLAELGLTQAVTVHGEVPSQVALDLLSRSHLALVLAQDQPMQVPGKLYECVAMGIPTLVISESTGASAREARRLGAMICDDKDVECIARVIEDLWLTGLHRPTGLAAGVTYDDIAGEFEGLLTSRPE